MKWGENIFWVGHACFYIKTKEGTVFIDPFKISSSLKEKADLVIITHAHFDHFNWQDVERVMDPKIDTKFILAEECVIRKGASINLFEAMASRNVLAVAKPGFKKKFGDITIEAVPAYNTDPARLQNHPKSKNWVGYVLTIDGTRIYHAGDTDFIPEMKSLNDIDIALLPMGGTYTMAVDEAIEAAKAINAKAVVPMHYKMLLGEKGSLELEKKLTENLSSAHIMKEVQTPLYSFQ